LDHELGASQLQCVFIFSSLITFDTAGSANLAARNYL
jgi:hypothetical protein